MDIKELSKVLSPFCNCSSGLYIKLPDNPIIEDVLKLSQRLPFSYDDVYTVWHSMGGDINKTKRYFRVEDDEL